MGGEPLLRFDLIEELVEWTTGQPWDKPYLFVGPTNGTLLDDRMKNWFKTHKTIVRLGLSIDGTPEMQNRNRSRSNDMIDLDFFRDTWPDNAVKMTISPFSVEQLYEGVCHLYRRGFRKISVEPAHGVSWSPENLLAYKRELEKLVRLYIKYPMLERISLLNIDLRKIKDRRVPHKKCGCGENFMACDTDGSPYPCHLFSPLVLNERQMDASRSIDFRNDELFICPTCLSCILHPICIGCCGINFLHNGDVGMQPSSLCKLFKIQFLANCRLQASLSCFYEEKEKNEIQDLLRFIKNCHPKKEKQNG